MVDLVGPAEAEFLEYELEDLEMIILLVAHHIDVRVKFIFGETPFSSAEILGDVH